MAQGSQLREDAFFADRRADGRDRDVHGDESDLEQIAAHHHQRLAAELRGEKLRMAREAERLALHVLLADRTRDDRVDRSGLQVGCRSLQRGDRGGSRRRRHLARLDAQFVGAAIDQVDAFRIGLGGRSYDVEAEVFGSLDLFLVKAGRLGRAVDDRRAQFADARVAKAFDDHFVSYSVRVSVCNAYLYFIVAHNVRFVRSNVSSRRGRRRGRSRGLQWAKIRKTIVNKIAGAV